MKILSLFFIILFNYNLLAQSIDKSIKKEIESVFYREYRIRYFFRHGRLFYTLPIRTLVVLYKDSTALCMAPNYSDIGPPVTVIQDTFTIKNDSIIFQGFGAGTLKDDKLFIPFYVVDANKAKDEDILKFLEIYGESLKRMGICFENTYIAPCLSH